MPPISYKYIEKLQKEIAEMGSWLSSTQADGEGAAQPEDLRTLYKKVYGLYQKALVLHQTTLEPTEKNDELEELRQDVANFDYWLSTEVSNNGLVDERQTVFTRANAISLKALSLYRSASQSPDDPQESAGDEPATLSGS